MLPRIQYLSGGGSHLIVEDEPFLLRAGELHNSSLSSSVYMDTVWSNMGEIGLNTVLGSVAWNQIEPREACYDFDQLDRVIRGAKENQLKLVLLWFGAYKNGESASHTKLGENLN